MAVGWLHFVLYYVKMSLCVVHSQLCFNSCKMLKLADLLVDELVVFTSNKSSTGSTFEFGCFRRLPAGMMMIIAEISL